MTESDLIDGKEYAIRYTFYNQEKIGNFPWSSSIDPRSEEEFFGFCTGERYIPFENVLEIREIPAFENLKQLYLR